MNVSGFDLPMSTTACLLLISNQTQIFTAIYQGECITVLDCADVLSVCSSQQCICQAGYVHDVALQRCCIADGSMCAADGGCCSNAICVNNTCQCIAGFTSYNGLCKGETIFILDHVKVCIICIYISSLSVL